MKELQSIKELARKIAGDLRNNKLPHVAENLESDISKLDDQQLILETLSKIIGACHIKAMGDLYLESFSGYEWPNKVGRLGEKCHKLRKIISHESNT